MKTFLLALALLVLPAAANAALLDQDGRIISSLPALAPGKTLLVTFGYTQCGDICPMDLMTMQAALAKLPAATRKQLQPVFVTVDPARDTPAALKTYLGSYSGVEGLTGTAADLDPLAKTYGIFHEADAGQPGLINHTQAVLLLAPDGSLTEAYTDPDAATLAADLQKRLK